MRLTPKANKNRAMVIKRVRVVETESTRLNMLARLNFSENALDLQLDHTQQGFAENFGAHF